MKSRVCSTPYFIPHQAGCRPRHFHSICKRTAFAAAKRSVRWQRNLLLGVSILVIFCWTIGSIWLISARREERRTAEGGERQGNSSVLYAAKADNSR